jgi:transketolase
MRTTFFRTLADLAKNDDRVNLVVADIGFGAVDVFTEVAPSRFTNVGIAEQNMIGVAAGLSSLGAIVFAYSIANFPTIRCLDQIRLDVCYHEANVVVVSGGSGLSYGSLGATHHATEDVAIMRALPKMRVVCPAGQAETEFVTRALVDAPGPAYLRLSRGSGLDTPAHPDAPIGAAIQVKAGERVAILGSGAGYEVAEGVARLLAARDRIEASLWSFPWVKPIDGDAITTLAKSHDLIVTVEEHSLLGGFGTAVLECLADNRLLVPVLRAGLPDNFVSVAGSQAYLTDIAGFTSERIASKVLRRLPDVRQR